MRIRPTRLDGVLLIEPDVFEDSRGSFQEIFRRERFAEQGLPTDFVQDNLSRSVRGVIRGMHFQRSRPQGKLVQAVQGTIFDVAVDLRPGSVTFGQWVGEILSDENHRQLFIPAGFAHGFSVVSESATVFYKCTAAYSPDDERTLLWNDPQVGIDWPAGDERILSEKDRRGTPLGNLDMTSS